MVKNQDGPKRQIKKKKNNERLTPKILINTSSASKQFGQTQKLFRHTPMTNQYKHVLNVHVHKHRTPPKHV